MLYNKTLSLTSMVWWTVITIPAWRHWEAVKPGKSYSLSSASTIPCRVQWYGNEVTLNHHKNPYNPWRNAERIWSTGVHLYPHGTKTDVMNWPGEYLAAWLVPYSTVFAFYDRESISERSGLLGEDGINLPKQSKRISANKLTRLIWRTLKLDLVGKGDADLSNRQETGATDVLGSNTCEITQRNLGMFLLRGG